MLRARSIEEKDARRKAMMAAALGEFFERGFTAARMDDIARRAGVSKAAVYLYFDSKEALFTALIEEYAIPNVERMEAAVSAAPDIASALKALTAIAPYLIYESEVPKIVKVLIGDSQNFPETVTRYRHLVIERVLGAISKKLRHANNAGEIEIDDPILTARLVVAPVIMSAVWHVVFEHEEDAKVDVAALMALHIKSMMRALNVRRSP